MLRRITQLWRSVGGRFSIVALLLLAPIGALSASALISGARITNHVAVVDEEQRLIDAAFRYVAAIETLTLETARYVRGEASPPGASPTAVAGLSEATAILVDRWTPARSTTLEKAQSFVGGFPRLISQFDHMRREVLRQRQAYTSELASFARAAVDVADRLERAAAPEGRPLSRRLRVVSASLLSFAAVARDAQRAEDLRRGSRLLAAAAVVLGEAEEVLEDRSSASAPDAVVRARRMLTRTQLTGEALVSALDGRETSAILLDARLSEQMLYAEDLLIAERGVAQEQLAQVVQIVNGETAQVAALVLASVALWVGVSLWFRATVVRPINAAIHVVDRLSETKSAPRLGGSSLNELARLNRAITGFAKSYVEIKKMSERIRRLANEDSLTGLHNRRSAPGAFHEQCAKLAGAGAWPVFMLIDIDDFKSINDANGHHIGDEALAVAAKVIAEKVDDEAVLARLGGDEFLVIAPTAAGRPPATEIVDAIGVALAEAAPLQRFSTPVTASIGYAEASSGPNDYDALLRQADLALSEAKRRGPSNCVAYVDSLGDRFAQREATLARIDQALRGGEIVPAYQAKICLRSGAIVGYEALARWRRPDGSVVGPGAFMDAIEDQALSTRISEAILEAVVTDIAACARRGLDCIRVAVNVTQPQVVDLGFSERIQDLCLAHGVTPNRLIIEITERVLMDSRIDAIQENLERLRRFGVDVALDDFGTGFASLTHLKDLRADLIKLDMSFVRSILADEKTRRISSSIVELAHGLGMKVVAEGIETAEIAAALREFGCDYAQGYHYSKPLLLEDAVNFATEWSVPQQVAARES